MDKLFILCDYECMQYISATDAKQNFGALIDKAQEQPLIIQRQNRDVAAVVSMASYEKLRKLAIAEMQDLRKEISSYAKSQGLTEEILQDILSEDS